MAPTVPPARDSWTYCLRKYAEHEPTIREAVNGYDEAVETYDITHRDEKRRRTVFIRSIDFRERLLKKGWEDVTALFDGVAQAEAPAAPPSKTEAPKRRAPPSRGVVARVEG